PARPPRRRTRARTAGAGGARRGHLRPRPDLLRGQRGDRGHGVRGRHALVARCVHRRRGPRVGGGGSVAAGPRAAGGPPAAGSSGPAGRSAAVRDAPRAGAAVAGGEPVPVGAAGRSRVRGLGRVHAPRPVGDAGVPRPRGGDRGVAAVLVPAVRGFGGGGGGDRPLRGTGAAPDASRWHGGRGAAAVRPRPVGGRRAARRLRPGGGGAAGVSVVGPLGGVRETPGDPPDGVLRSGGGDHRRPAAVRGGGQGVAPPGSGHPGPWNPRCWGPEPYRRTLTGPPAATTPGMGRTGRARGSGGRTSVGQPRAACADCRQGSGPSGRAAVAGRTVPAMRRPRPVVARRSAVARRTGMRAVLAAVANTGTDGCASGPGPSAPARGGGPAVR